MKFFFQPFLERRGDWTYCALAIRHLSQEDAGNYTVSVRNKYGEKSNHVRLSMKDQNEPAKYANSNQLLLYYLYYLYFFKNIFSTEYPVALNPRSSENPHLDKKVGKKQKVLPKSCYQPTI